MVIKKDPDDLPSELVEFEEVFDDINSPEIWIAESESDLSPKLIVLDGHSSVFVYSQESEELKWNAYNEIGQYEYTPDNLGDGMVNFPHTFYFEFEIELSDKKLDVNCTFDGTGVKALVMPMKDIPISEFMETLKSRLSSLFSSVLKPNDDDLAIVAGEKLVISEDMQSNLSLKLAFMGIDIKKLVVDKITPYEPIKEEIVEEVFEVPAEEEEKLEEAPPAAPTPQPPKVETPKPSPPPVAPKPSSTPVETPDIKPPSEIPPSPPPGPVDVEAASAPPPAKTQKIEPAAAPPTTAPKAKEGVQPAPPAPGGPPPKAKKKRTRSPTPPSAPEPKPTMDDKKVIDQMEVPEEDKDELELFATGMEREKKISLRHTHATYFERMVTNRAYPLVIRISTDEMKVKGSVTSQLTGERISEKQEQITVEEDTLLTVEPEFPGCLVVPTQHQVDIQQSDVKIRFHVTPLALGNLDAKVNFLQNNKTVHSMQLETKVINHRLSKWSAILGALGGTLPAFLAFTTGETPQTYLRSRFGDLGLVGLANLGYVFPILLMSFFFGFAGFFYWLQKPQKRSRSVAFPR